MAITNIQINTHHMLKKACLKRDGDFGLGLYRSKMYRWILYFSTGMFRIKSQSHPS